MLTALAQTTTSTTALYFGSIGGIIVATIALVAALRRALADVPAAKSVPVWVYAATTAVALTAFAHYVLKTLDGEIIDLVLQAVIAAGAASGFREWVKDVNVTPKTIKAGALILSCFLIVGCCSDPGAYAHLKASQKYHETIGRQVVSYVESLPNEDEADRLVKQSIFDAHQTFGEANEAREKDLGTSPLLGN